MRCSSATQLDASLRKGLPQQNRRRAFAVRRRLFHKCDSYQIFSGDDANSRTLSVVEG